MKKYSFSNLLQFILHRLTKYFTNGSDLNSDDIEKLSIGLTVILLNIFEMTLVFILSFFLGITKETLIFCIIFAVLRALGCGVHCKTSGQCIIVTLTLYLVCGLLSKYFPINTLSTLCTSLICTTVLYKYSPADTENRPILGELKRKSLKNKITIVSIFIIFINLIISNKTLFNSSMYAMIVEAISVIPFTYKLFNVNYNNYKLYE